MPIELRKRVTEGSEEEKNKVLSGPNEGHYLKSPGVWGSRLGPKRIQTNSQQKEGLAKGSSSASRGQQGKKNGKGKTRQ